MKWETMPSPWFGWQVWKRVFNSGFASGFKIARNRFGLSKWFLTEKAAQAHADALNGVNHQGSDGL